MDKIVILIDFASLENRFLSFTVTLKSEGNQKV